jgi:predicted Fe-S protein YdhL (DUF1289 family)
MRRYGFDRFRRAGLAGWEYAMALFPKIQSPCPYQGDLSAIMDGDMCRLCKRQVFDLTAMSDGQRVAFMKSCSGEVCVSYRLPVAVAAAALALAIPTAAAAQVEVVVISGGGIKDLSRVEYIHVPDDKAVPPLPVVYDDKPAVKDETPVPSAKPSSAP